MLVKGNSKENMTQATTPRSLRSITPSGRWQTRKPAHRTTPWTGHSEKSKTTGRERRSVGQRHRRAPKKKGDLITRCRPYLSSVSNKLKDLTHVREVGMWDIRVFEMRISCKENIAVLSVGRRSHHWEHQHIYRPNNMFVNLLPKTIWWGECRWQLEDETGPAGERSRWSLFYPLLPQ